MIPSSCAAYYTVSATLYPRILPCYYLFVVQVSTPCRRQEQGVLVGKHSTLMRRIVWSLQPQFKAYFTRTVIPCKKKMSQTLVRDRIQIWFYLFDLKQSKNWPVSLSLNAEVWHCLRQQIHSSCEWNTFRLPADVNSLKEDNCMWNLLNSNREKGGGHTVKSNEALVCEVHLKKKQRLGHKAVGRHEMITVKACM